jgi:ubiquinone/menaquinone biosynthesis C-methylase UbiE
LKKEYKDRWYNGWFYDLFIAPNQDRLFGQIKNLIESNSKVIDVGCGTGRFSFSTADKFKSILGIDLSKRNVDRSNQKLKRNPNAKISFQHKSVSEIISEGKEHYDYAVITYVIHEINENKRGKLLSEVAQVADKIIIGDYIAPKPKGFMSLLNEIVEYAAGKDHYRNFKSYINKDGIQGLVRESGFKILNELKNNPSTSHIMVLKKVEQNEN